MTDNWHENISDSTSLKPDIASLHPFVQCVHTHTHPSLSIVPFTSLPLRLPTAYSAHLPTQRSGSWMSAPCFAAVRQQHSIVLITPGFAPAFFMVVNVPPAVVPPLALAAVFVPGLGDMDSTWICSFPSLRTGSVKARLLGWRRSPARREVGAE